MLDPLKAHSWPSGQDSNLNVDSKYTSCSWGSAVGIQSYCSCNRAPPSCTCSLQRTNSVVAREAMTVCSHSHGAHLRVWIKAEVYGFFLGYVSGEGWNVPERLRGSLCVTDTAETADLAQSLFIFFLTILLTLHLWRDGKTSHAN